MLADGRTGGVGSWVSSRVPKRFEIDEVGNSHCQTAEGVVGVFRTPYRGKRTSSLVPNLSTNGRAPGYRPRTGTGTTGSGRAGATGAGVGRGLRGATDVNKDFCSSSP